MLGMAPTTDDESINQPASVTDREEEWIPSPYQTYKLEASDKADCQFDLPFHVRAYILAKLSQL